MKSRDRHLILIAHNVRSAHNVGSLLRTADGLGLDAVYMTGYTPYPEKKHDQRPPHIRRKMSASITKTALGAEQNMKWNHYPDITDCLKEVSDEGYQVVALEQTAKAVNITDFTPRKDIALVVGSEIGGLDDDLLNKIGVHVRIPMLGNKESFNVSIASAIALYHLRHLDKHTA